MLGRKVLNCSGDPRAGWRRSTSILRLLTAWPARLPRLLTDSDAFEVQPTPPLHYFTRRPRVNSIQTRKVAKRRRPWNLFPFICLTKPRLTFSGTHSRCWLTGSVSSRRLVCLFTAPVLCTCCSGRWQSEWWSIYGLRLSILKCEYLVNVNMIVVAN